MSIANTVLFIYLFKVTYFNDNQKIVLAMIDVIVLNHKNYQYCNSNIYYVGYAAIGVSLMILGMIYNYTKVILIALSRGVRL